MKRSRGNAYKLHQETFHLGINFLFFFYSENNQSLAQHPQGRGGVSITRGFQDATRWGATESHLGSLSQERLDQVIF